MAKQFLILLFILFSIPVNAQTPSFQEEKPFINHLDSLKVPEEKVAYLEFLQSKPDLQNNDTLKLELAHTYFVNNKFEKAITSYSSITGFLGNIKFEKEYGFCLLKEKRYKQYLERTGNTNESPDSTLIIQKLTAETFSSPENERAQRMLRNLIPIQIPEKNLKKKSPLLAGLYSAIIPGTGKLYCGKKHQFVTSLLTNIAFGYQAYEANVKDGTNSTRFIVSGILFSFFYIGNIWGSVLEARNHHLEQYKQFENEVLDYNSILVNQ